MKDRYYVQRLTEHLLDEARVTRIVFDEFDGQRARHDRYFGGNLTMVNQKSSMDRTTSRNCCRPMGLVT